jgi:multiple sugar transport system permease protein
MGVIAVLERASGRRISRLKFRENIEGWLFIAPVVFGMAAFQFFPIAVSIYASFTDWDGVNPARFVGLDNYIRLFTNDMYFVMTLKNTLYYTFGHIPLTILCALLLALLCNRKMKGVTWYRTFYFTPVVTNTVAISLVWYWIYAPDVGVLNWLLSLIGIKGPAWLSEQAWAMPAVILVSVWHGVGYPMVILLAGLQNIPEVLYEAAAIDGAGTWHKFWHVTLPLLTPSLFFLLITQFISSFQVFGLIFVMTQGGPAFATTVYVYYLYQNAFAWWKMGYAAAMAWILFVIVASVTFIQWKLQRKWVFYG